MNAFFRAVVKILENVKSLMLLIFILLEIRDDVLCLVWCTRRTPWCWFFLSPSRNLFKLSTNNHKKIPSFLILSTLLVTLVGFLSSPSPLFCSALPLKCFTARRKVLKRERANLHLNQRERADVDFNFLSRFLYTFSPPTFPRLLSWIFNCRLFAPSFERRWRVLIESGSETKHPRRISYGWSLQLQLEPLLIILVSF